MTHNMSIKRTCLEGIFSSRQFCSICVSVWPFLHPLQKLPMYSDAITALALFKWLHLNGVKYFISMMPIFQTCTTNAKLCYAVHLNHSNTASLHENYFSGTAFLSETKPCDL